MNNFYLIGFVIFSIVILFKYISYKSRDKFEIQNSNKSEISDPVNELTDEYFCDFDAPNDEATILENELLSYPDIQKNKFLYPDAEFDKEANNKSNHVSQISIDDYDILADASSLNEKIATVETSKNKWLYPDDGLGKMERGLSF